MKVVILAGGLGTRFAEETALKPKPMIEIGGMPILWHIMKIYAAHGLTEFIICAGYLQNVIKDFFADYALRRARAMTFNLGQGTMRVDASETPENWTVTVVDTGAETMTGGRVKRVAPYLNKDTPFCLTYGDGLADIDIRALIAFHRQKAAHITLSAVYPPARFGALEIENGLVRQFIEKRPADERLINGGFMVIEPAFLNEIEGDRTVLEQAPMAKAAEQGRLAAYEHRGFWQCMDKNHDRQYLESLWQQGRAPWKVWA